MRPGWNLNQQPWQNQLLCLINAERTNRGLAPVGIMSALNPLALEYADPQFRSVAQDDFENRLVSMGVGFLSAYHAETQFVLDPKDVAENFLVEAKTKEEGLFLVDGDVTWIGIGHDDSDRNDHVAVVGIADGLPPTEDDIPDCG